MKDPQPATLPRKKTGRPTKYRTEYVEQSSKLAALGATLEQMADFFKVRLSTFKVWLVTHAELAAAVKPSKETADARVEESLYQRALGYTHDEVDIRVVRDKVVMTPIRKHYPPDVTACIFWLKNRRPDLWRERPGEAGGLTAEQAALMAQEAIAAASATSGSAG